MRVSADYLFVVDSEFNLSDMSFIYELGMQTIFLIFSTRNHKYIFASLQARGPENGMLMGQTHKISVNLQRCSQQYTIGL